jgi:hypothetical protein
MTLPQRRGVFGATSKRRDELKSTLAALALVLSLSAAEAGGFNMVDWNGLAPCKPAAARYCDRSEGVTMSSLMRCGAKLASVSDHVGNRCREVLRRYGQL